MAGVSFPSRCAVAVICGDRLVSQVYPASVPVEAFVDSAVELIHEDLKRRGGGLDTAESYELQRANGSRLDPTKTLEELGVEDGSTLVLAPVDDGDSFEPHYEALSTGLARVSQRLFSPVTAETAARAAMAIVAMALLTITGLAVSIRYHSTSLAPAVFTGGVGLLISAGATWVWRWWPDRTELFDALTWMAVPPVAAGFALAAPGGLGSAQVFIACVVAAVGAVAIAVLADRHVTVAAAVIALCTIGALIAAVRMLSPIPFQRIAMCVLLALLFITTMAPTMALWAARIRPPHFGSITGRDLFRRGDGMAPDAVAPVEEEVETDSDADWTPNAGSIRRAALRANSVLTGICVAVAVVLPFAAAVALMPGQARGNATMVLVLLFAWIYLVRARVFTDRRQAVPLVFGAAATVCVVVTRHVLSVSNGTLVWGGAALVVFAAAALAAGLVVPATKFTPLVRMTVEWLELAAIVVVLPLAAWIGGLFAWIRMR